MYVNAEQILPAQLLRQVQEYVQGTELYIPKVADQRRRWGECSGTRMQIAARNAEIYQDFCAGATIMELTDRFHLSYDSIRKIVQKERRRDGNNGS